MGTGGKGFDETDLD